MIIIVEQFEKEKLELDLLCKGIYEVWGYDFRHYAKASFSRRINQFVSDRGYASISHLLAEILHSDDLISDLVTSISVTTSDMFRDPHVFRFIRSHVIPYLKTYPSVRIWHAACGKGEEIYSMAILLKEEGLYDKCTIYATDMNEDALNHVRKGIYSLRRIKDFSRNYIEAGGKASLSDYYYAKFDNAKFNKNLLENITFSNHNLTVDSVFLEANFILCRNVMIYFNRELQQRVLDLIDQSLIPRGLLCIGAQESLAGTVLFDRYEPLSDGMKIFKKGLEK